MSRKRTLRRAGAGVLAAGVAAGAFAIATTSAQADTAILGADDPDAISGEYFVVFKDGASAQDSATVASSAGVDDVTTYGVLDGFFAEMTEEQAKELADDSRVDYVEQNRRVHTMAPGEQTDATWGLDRTDQRDLPLDQTYGWDEDGNGVTAYIVDTGVLSTHSEFEGRMAEGFDAIEDGNGTEDCNGHGTHVAGTTAGSTYGVAKEATVVPVRVLDCNGSGSFDGVIAGIEWVAENAEKPAVANMSLGGTNSDMLNDAVDNAVASGVSFAVAAGNSDNDACGNTPAGASDVITVAATDDSDARATFSSWGSCVEIFAPGVDITSAWHTGDEDTNTISGTSMATPHVAGAVAVYLSANPEATPAEVTEWLTSNATPDVVQDPKDSPNALLYGKFE
ncbi:S8 family peptidase [Salininema proteolyticum]|uniref:S8 family peptidase n=1 Tax=Salininema proteolyticum TaxID=1607685 RepID=A0ABV8TX68_9ACTN